MACSCHPVGSIVAVIVCCSASVLIIPEHTLGRLDPLLGPSSLLCSVHKLFESHINVTIDIGLIVGRICDGTLKNCQIFIVVQYHLQSLLDTEYVAVQHSQFQKHG